MVELKPSMWVIIIIAIIIVILSSIALVKFLYHYTRPINRWKRKWKREFKRQEIAYYGKGGRKAYEKQIDNNPTMRAKRGER